MVRQGLLDRVKAKIADRIQRACAHLSPADFDALVTRMAHVEIKYSTRRTADLFEGASDADKELSQPDGRQPPGAKRRGR